MRLILAYYTTSVFDVFFILLNQDESAARLCRQVAQWIQDMFRNFYLV